MKYDLFIFTTAICRPELHSKCMIPFARALNKQGIKTKWFINIDPYPNQNLVKETKDNLTKALDFDNIDLNFTTPSTACFYTAVKTLVNKMGEEIDSLTGYVMPLEDDWKLNIDFEIRELLESGYDDIGFHNHNLLIGDLSFNPSLWKKNFFLNFVKTPFDLCLAPLDPEQVVINYHKNNIAGGNNYMVNVKKIQFPGVFEDAGREWASKNNIAKWSKYSSREKITYKESKRWKLLIAFPTRERPDKFLEVFSKYREYSICPETSFLISCDKDDSSMNQKAIIDKINSLPNCQIIFNPNNSKVEAINSAVVNQEFDVCLLASDDMIPEAPGYDKIIINDMQEHFPDTDGVLWYNDGNRSDLNTLCILGFKYYKRFNYIYHPSYKSLSCDKEFTEVSVALKKCKYFSTPIIRHKHYTYEEHNLKSDPLYEKNLKNAKEDEDTFQLRKANNFN